MTISRRQFVQAAAAAGTVSALNARAATAAEASSDLMIGHGDFKYRVDKAWGNLDPAKTPVNNCHEMVIDSKGRLLLFNDDTRNNVLVYDLDGKLLDAWGTEYPGGHGITLAPENGTDYLFLTDCGWHRKRGGRGGRMNGRVVKTTIDGNILFSIGHPQTVGAYEPGARYQPTEVAVAPNGDFYIADGYGSDYLLHYDHNGQFLNKFGGRHNDNPEANFYCAHGVVVDTRKDEKNPTLVCSSRADNCFRLYTPDGQYIKTIPLPGGFVCRPIIKGDYLYATIIKSTQLVDGKPAGRKGFIIILDKDYKVVSCPGGVEPTYNDGKLARIYQAKDAPFKHPHDVCVDDDENLYVCQWNSGKTYPIKLHRVRS